MNDIIKFYLDYDEIREKLGFTLDDVIHESDEWLEGCHNHIQWLFPLTEPSNFNPDAPLLTQEDIDCFQSSRLLQNRLITAIERMTLFYKYTDWISPNNHNFLRITRILKCISLLLPTIRAAQMKYKFYIFIKDKIRFYHRNNQIKFCEWLVVPLEFWEKTYNEGPFHWNPGLEYEYV